MSPSAPALIRVHSESNAHSPTLLQSEEETTPNHAPRFSVGDGELINGDSKMNHANIAETKKVKRVPTDKAYFIAKELLMTERTYHKDLSIVIKYFKEHTPSGGDFQQTLERLFKLLQPVYDAHSVFLDSLEKRLAQTDSKITDTFNVEIGDIVTNHFEKLPLYRDYLCSLEEILTELVNCTGSDEDFARHLHSFEMEKICYLPLFSLLLKPAHRLVCYEIVLSKLVAHYSVTSSDYNQSKDSLSLVTEALGCLRSIIAELENTEKLIELQEDIAGIEGLVYQGRYFIREGCLQKLSRRGYQQRLFLLLSDVLLYTSRAPSSQLQFKVHGYLPLSGMSLEEGDSNVGVPNGFTIYGANRCLIVAANTQEEKDKWIEDLNFAISIANSDQIELAELPLPQVTPPSNGVKEGDSDPDESGSSPEKPQQQTQHRSNTTMHVCWHRNTSVSIKDIQNAIKHQLSGYLLRKFKNSNGWQKLWVVFTNFCLFFYKTYQDEFPLASLPLLGYSVSKPSASDGIHKDFVFKLQFKNHVYFFRAESEYTFDRWMEVINSATHSARRTRMFSRLDSTN